VLDPAPTGRLVFVAAMQPCGQDLDLRRALSPAVGFPEGGPRIRRRPDSGARWRLRGEPGRSFERHPKNIKLLGSRDEYEH